MTIQVSADTLIPRPETEYLVELALEKIPLDARWTIADLGTGSGAIALAIARERPLCQVVATDASARALKMAKENAHRLTINTINFVEGRWFEPLDGQPFEMVVSNPPYVRPGDPHLTQGDLRFEPIQALRSEPDGLTDLRAIIESARKHLEPPGWLILEHGYDQGSVVTAILDASGYSQVSTAVDLTGHERVTMGNWRPK
jgi:release factor glutamine methyltransferase